MRASASRSRSGRSGSSGPCFAATISRSTSSTVEHLRQRPAAARALDGERRIVGSQVFGVEVLVELPDGGKAARQRRGLQTFPSRVRRDSRARGKPQP